MAARQPVLRPVLRQDALDEGSLQSVGGLDIGMNADVIALDTDGHVQRAWIGGISIETNGVA